MNFARDEKLALLKWLLPEIQDDEVLAAEVPFRDVGRKADLAVLSPTRLHVIEIKGPRDNLDKLEDQARDYLDSFLTVDVALASRFVGTARRMLPQSIGILELDGTSVVRRRKPQTRKLLSKRGALAWLHAKDIQKLLGPTSRGLDITSLRALAEVELSIVQLTAAALKAAYSRSQSRYMAFLSERSDRLILDDLAVLELPTRIR